MITKEEIAAELKVEAKKLIETSFFKDTKSYTPFERRMSTFVNNFPKGDEFTEKLSKSLQSIIKKYDIDYENQDDEFKECVDLAFKESVGMFLGLETR